MPRLLRPDQQDIGRLVGIISLPSVVTHIVLVDQSSRVLVGSLPNTVFQQLLCGSTMLLAGVSSQLVWIPLLPAAPKHVLTHGQYSQPLPAPPASSDSVDAHTQLPHHAPSSKEGNASLLAASVVVPSLRRCPCVAPKPHVVRPASLVSRSVAAISPRCHSRTALTACARDH